MMLSTDPPPRGFWATVFAGLWAGANALRRGLSNLLFGLLFMVLVAGAWGWAVSAWNGRLQEKTVLVLDLAGEVVEQRGASWADAAGRRASGAAPRAIVLRDVLRVLDHAGQDPDIASVLVLTDGASPGGLPTQRELAAALGRFRATGKKVVSWATRHDQRTYYIAAQADEVYLHPMGSVLIEGYGRHRNYYRDALDRLGVSAHVVRAGRFKNAAEPFFANAPSPETLESDGEMLRALWDLYTEGVEKARRLPAGQIARAIDELPGSLQAVGGDAARLALEGKLVDGLMTGDTLRTVLTERGAADEQRKSFRQISWRDYLARVPVSDAPAAVGVVVAEGEIVEGDAGPGRVGGRSTAALIRQAREDARLQAVVLRVDSPGGSALASEMIRRELELTRAAGKPVVVSMGDVAASGGYWISLAADEVVADPATLTGSIGVFALLPTAEGLMDKLSVRVGGTATTWLAPGFDPRRPLDPRFGQMVQSVIDRIYADFTAKTAAARKLRPDGVEPLAQGRVWTGAQARERGLLDRLGSYGDALDAARARAKLPPGAPVVFVEPPRARWQRALDFLGVTESARDLVAALHTAASSSSAISALPPFAALLADELSGLASSAGTPWPAGTVHCLCAAP